MMITRNPRMLSASSAAAVSLCILSGIARADSADAINYREKLYADDRPIPITDRGQPITELFA
jgi:hypothetical protein